jgi:UDP:flavonoid glycosyltransferase YjiC (YdhE family)
MTGYWYPQEKEWQPPDDLVKFLDSGSPPVFFGFGSMPIKNPQKATELIISALKQTGQRGILHSGWGGLGKMKLSENIFRIDYAPYDWLFPRMAMIFHHGGAGTTAFGFRSGVPCCVIPFLFDQFYWGKRVSQLGVGTDQIPYKKMTARKLINAIESGIHDTDMQKKAADLGKEIQLENGIHRAVEIIEKMI